MSAILATAEVDRRTEHVFAYDTDPTHSTSGRRDTSGRRELPPGGWTNQAPQPSGLDAPPPGESGGTARHDGTVYIDLPTQDLGRTRHRRPRPRSSRCQGRTSQ